MNKNIRLLVEEYFNSTEQMNNLLKQNQKELNKFNKNNDSRQEFIKAVLGKQTYNKYTNKGTFAPLPLSGLHFIFDDFYYLNNDLKKSKTLDPVYEKKTEKLISLLNKYYDGKEFKFVYSGVNNILSTNIVFRTIDEVIDFLTNIKKAYKQVYKSENINWTYITKKFRKYIN